MASVRQVAREAGVSIATVSRVLNGNQSVADDLRKRVLDAAGTCNYTRVLERKSARVGWLYTGDFYFDCAYDSACFEGVARAMRRSNYEVALVDFARDRKPGETLSRFLQRKALAGAVVRTTVEHRPMFFDEPEIEALPISVVGDHFEHPGLHFTYSDSRGASREAIEHLVELGHQRIACVLCDREDGDHIDRLTAYREVMGSAGLYRTDDEHRVPPFRMDAVPLARRLLSQQDRPTALFVADPMVAVGIIVEAQNLGARIGDDLSVIGFDDTDVRHFTLPKMTAVCQDSRLVGEAAFEAVRERIEGKPCNDGFAKTHAAWLEIQDTTGPAPATVKRFLPSG